MGRDLFSVTLVPLSQSNTLFIPSGVLARCLKAVPGTPEPIRKYSLVDLEADISKDIQRPRDVVRVVSPYDVSPDDQRFVLIRVRDETAGAGSELILVQNFFEELKAKVGS